jgi:hypothetical protein
MPIPMGAYAQCIGTVVDGGLTVAGGPTGALTLSESDGVLHAEFGTGLFAIGKGTLAFTPITNSVAVVAPGQTYTLSVDSCATSTASSGALALAGDSLVMTILGKGCGGPIFGTIRCPLPSAPTGALEAPDPCEAGADCACAGAPPFPLGVYGTCTPAIPEYERGQLTLTESNGVWTAALDDVDEMTAHLVFSPSTPSAAVIVPGQALDVKVDGWACSGPVVNDSGLPSDPGPTQRTIRITNGSFVLDGSNLFAFIGGVDECGTQDVEYFNCPAPE